MSTPSSGATGPELRIGDAERESAVTALGEHYAAGRLTKEEFDERSTHAYAARTRSALWPLFSDLPRPQQERPAASDPGDGHHSGAWHGHRGRHGAGLLPVLVVVLIIGLLTHFWLLPLVLVAVVVVKLSRTWGYAAGYRRHGHHG